MKTAWLIPLLALFSCGAVKFDVDQDLASETVQGTSLLGGVLSDFVAQPFQININIQQEVAKRGTGPATSAQLTQLTFAITPHAAPVGNFDFLSSAHLFVNAPGLSMVEVAKVDPAPKSATTLTFDLTPDVDLLPYINAGATISATATGTQPKMDITFDGHVQVEVRI